MMANKLTSMQTLRTIMQLAGRSLSQRAISRQLNLSRNTVSHYLQQVDATQLAIATLQAVDDAALAALIYPAASAAGDDMRHSHFCKQVPYQLAKRKRTGFIRQLL